MRNKYVFTAALLAFITAISAAVIHFTAEKEEQRGEEETLQVVTSFYPMYVAAENVIRDVPGIRLTNLTEPKTGCLHDYQLTPQDMLSLADADVFIINGGGIESFVEQATASYPKLQIVTASEGVKMLENGEWELHEDSEEHAGHDHGDVNPHVWMDVSKYMQEVDNIAEGLAQAAPGQANQLYANAVAYREQLEGLRREAESLKSEIGEQEIIIFHDSFAYFADAYGLHVADVVEVEEDNTLSAGQLAHLADVVRREHIGMLFVEKQYSVKAAEALAKESGARVYVLDSLVTGDGSADSYLRGMEENLKVLREALGNGKPQS